MFNIYSPIRIICLMLLLLLGILPPTRAARAAASPWSYRAAPSISAARYTQILCARGSPMCADAAALYALLHDAGIDPVLELAHAAKESGFGSAGIGRPSAAGGQYNAHGVRCNAWDGGGCRGRFSVYASYGASVRAWIILLTTRGIYLDAGRTTLDAVVPQYCPASECDGDAYMRQLKGWIGIWRGDGGIAHTEGGATPPLRDPTGRMLGLALMEVTRTDTGRRLTVQMTNYRPQPLTLQGAQIALIDARGRRYALGALTVQAGETVRLLIDAPLTGTGIQLAVQSPDDPIVILPVS